MKTNITRQPLTNCLSLGLASLFFLLSDAKISHSDDGWGAVDGAIWRVKLTPQLVGRGPKAEKAVPMSGHYRVEKLVLYQSEGKKDKELGRKIGKSEPVRDAKKPTTIVEFTDFIVHNRESKLHLKLSGKAKLIKEEKEQKATGIFVEGKDGGGWKWDIEITRVKE
jgi:hypothetical protein